MRLATVFAFTFAFVFFAAFEASGDPIFPPLVSGEYSFKIRAATVELDAEGVPTTTPTRSVGIRRADTGDPTILVCEPCGPGETVPVLVTVVASGDRADLRGFAFSEPGCVGRESLASVDGAFLFFVPPAPPALEPPGS